MLLSLMTISCILGGKMIDEYDITLAVKEWLLDKGWEMVAFNPPGSQGTFTIPNPSKDPRYRGQSGSEAPDIIAIKNNTNILIVECKPQYNEKDIQKLIYLKENKERVDLLIRLLEGVCLANDVPFKSPPNIILAKAHGGEEKLMDSVHTFKVTVKDGWNSKSIDPSKDPYDFMHVEFKTSDERIKEIVEE
jgi:hypothetical protein